MVHSREERWVFLKIELHLAARPRYRIKNKGIRLTHAASTIKFCKPIISNNCLFGAGTLIANFRFDEKNIKVWIENKEVDSGLNKLGAIIGDNCKTGINSCIVPGVKIGPQSIVGPNVHLQEDLNPKKIILVNKKSYIKKENEIPIQLGSKKHLKKKLMKK